MQMTDTHATKRELFDCVDGAALTRRIAVCLCSCVLSMLALQISVQAGEQVSEAGPLKCVLVETGDFQMAAAEGIADITVCHRPLHDEAFPVLHNAEPWPDEFEVFNDRVDEPAPATRPDWQDALVLIALN